jgi:hypothetical protein
MPSRTVRLVEIADILGVTHQRASVIVRQPVFPAPIDREGQSRVWDRREVTAWAKVWRREKPWRLRPSLLAVAAVWSGCHDGQMSATPVSQRPHWVYLAALGALCATAVALFAISIALVRLASSRDAPPGIIAATIALMVGTGAFCVWIGSAFIYQARARWSALLGRGSLLLAPPPVMRVSTGVIAASLGTITAALATANPPPIFVMLTGAAFLTLALIASRFRVLRLEANGWGIRCTNPVGRISLPWNRVVALGTCGRLQRIVLVTVDQRERMLWTLDPRIPANRGSTRVLVAELDAIRQSAA